MRTLTYLAQAAIDAHRGGLSWTEWWEVHRHTVGQIEPHDRQRYQRLLRRLTAVSRIGKSVIESKKPITVNTGKSGHPCGLWAWHTRIWRTSVSSAGTVDGIGGIRLI
jgi:hypothetical protein